MDRPLLDRPLRTAALPHSTGVVDACDDDHPSHTEVVANEDRLLRSLKAADRRALDALLRTLLADVESN